jgi:hypothetical protein
VCVDPKPRAIAPEKHHLWDISLMHLPSRQQWSSLVDPQLEHYPAPPPGHPRVTAEFLRANRAQPFSVVAERLKRFVAAFSRGCPSVFVSHGAFLLDKPVLEAAFCAAGVSLPPGTLFFDTFPHFRRHFQPRPPGGYSLGCLLDHVKGAPQDGPRHRAAHDVRALECILAHAVPGSRHLGASLRGAYHAPGSTSLQRIPGIGDKREVRLWTAGLCSVEQCAHLLVHRRLEAHLVQCCGLPAATAASIAKSVQAFIIKRSA